MAIGVFGKILEYGDPPTVLNGTVVTPTYGANMTATVNGLVAGTNALLGTAGGTSLPTPAFTRGALYLEGQPFAMCSSDGTNFTAGMNVASWSKTGTGLYQFTLNTHASSAGRLVMAGATLSGFVEATASDDHTIVVGVMQVSTVPTINFANNAWTLVVYHT